ncbi:Protein of unknown function (DUF3095) [Seminavis robusta]|uniref:DUF3095 domain-containing protein n=1 Tax=Seminavis robusta TaxID=568900 RepID=A0A9N8HEE0_9STRA|nr:Protein of unknown function (DUF3095) [Seminavis robusta]|eukprot:Sro300_g111600.1 Protein of unknown function (DUF3095) (649) ;mRNA; r:7648-9669
MTTIHPVADDPFHKPIIASPLSEQNSGATCTTEPSTHDHESATSLCKVDKAPDSLKDEQLSRVSSATASTVATSDDEEDSVVQSVEQATLDEEAILMDQGSESQVEESTATTIPKNLAEEEEETSTTTLAKKLDGSVSFLDSDDGDHNDGKSENLEEIGHRSSSTVRFGSIVMNGVDVDAWQEEREERESQKSWWEKHADWVHRSLLQEQVEEQMQKLHATQEQEQEPQEGESTTTKLLTSTLYPSPTGEGVSVSIKFRETQSFYTAIPSFTEFKDITRDNHFQLAPADWHVVITDVKGSTKAIEEGRYKDVNTIGAASISVVLKLLEEDVPFVFGGDGATLLIPPTDIGRVLEALLRLQRLSEQNFQLGLRVGHISVGEVHSSAGGAARIEVAKHELTAGRCVAVFRGGGLTVAEACIKGQEDKYCVEWKHDEDDVELGGLSCRWNPIPNKRGTIMSLLVCAREGESPAKVYDQVLRELDKIYDGKLDEANPVNTDLLYYKTVGQCYEDEKRYHTNHWTTNFMERVSEIFLAVGIFGHQMDTNLFDHKHYFESMRQHADHRKFDDMLRMILDCSDEQAQSIERLLGQLHKDQMLHYGIHLSDTALMTCYLEDVVDGQHIHFIDGGDGGYAMAAKQLKAQLKSDLVQA